jgi:hypothetical protein
MRFSGQKRQNFFHEALKANGRAGFSRSPVFDSVPEPEKNQLAHNRCSQPENKKTEK